jgi:hypothetical protein
VSTHAVNAFSHRLIARSLVIGLRTLASPDYDSHCRPFL